MPTREDIISNVNTQLDKVLTAVQAVDVALEPLGTTWDTDQLKADIQALRDSVSTIPVSDDTPVPEGDDTGEQAA